MMRNAADTHFQATASRSLGVWWVGLVLALTGLAAAAVEPVTGAQPWDPQPEKASLNPGLAVTYAYGRQVHVDDIETLDVPVIGRPLANIAHRTVDGNVLTSDRPLLVAAHIRGLIRFNQTGTYTFRVESNDGVKVRIGGKRVWYDPEIHANRWSPPIPFDVVQTGWYELWINYYQKKGTSALQLMWKLPGSQSRVHVPPDALAHLDKQIGQ